MMVLALLQPGSWAHAGDVASYGLWTGMLMIAVIILVAAAATSRPVR